MPYLNQPPKGATPNLTPNPTHLSMLQALLFATHHIFKMRHIPIQTTNQGTHLRVVILKLH
jgi:hypothetical protein